MFPEFFDEDGNVKELVIDINNLDEAASLLASWYYAASKEFVKQEADTKRMKAELSNQIRADPLHYGAKEKVSEAFLESFLPSIDEYREIVVQTDLLSRLVKALEFRAQMIGILQRLFQNNYFVASKSLGEQVREEDFVHQSKTVLEDSPKLKKLKRKLMDQIKNKEEED
jgi:hypothetical protein